ncbi:MAG: hypothetical protein HY791_04975 [Deltaproteobacteria bacterium]|nr:hypothetical protein [Deltaproteobacteria bacterium]
MSLKKGLTYLVESPEDSSVLLALDARVHDGLIDWFDTVRDRAFPIKSSKDQPDGLEVVTERATYRFKRLTKDLYDSTVVAKVTGSRPFATTEELQEFYRKFSR